MKKVFLVIILLVGTILQAQYKMPPKKIADAFNAPQPQFYSIIQNTTKAIEYKYYRNPPLERLMHETLGLGGKKIVPATNAEPDNRPYYHLAIKDFTTGDVVNILDSEDKYVYEFSVSPDRKYIAYTTELENGIYLKVKDVDTGKSLYKSDFKINASLNYLVLNWNGEEGKIITAKIPENRGDVPKKGLDSVAPRVQEADGKVSRVRTYTNLLQNKYEEELFEYYFTSQIVRVDFINNEVENIGKPNIFRNFTFSPDKKYILVKTTEKPYSYAVPYYRFGYDYQIWDSNGNFVKSLVKKPVQDQIPVWGVETGLRYPFWISSKDATLLWSEAQDGGDPKASAEYRDFLYTQEAPFDGEKELFLKLKERFEGADFIDNSDNVIITEGDYDKEWGVSYIVDVDNPQGEKTIIEDRSWDDKYSDPGKLLKHKDENGFEVVLEKDGYVYYKGNGYTPDGMFPFLDKVNVKTWEKERLFQSDKEAYERFSGFFGADFNKLIILSENSQTPPNYYLYTKDEGMYKQLSDNVNHTPEITEIRKEIVKYEREDSLLLSGTLYYPVDYEEGKRYPLLIWAYPQEFSDPELASQVSGSDNKFLRFWASSPLYMALHGYMVLHNAAMPVIGDVEKRNDTFATQIVQNAKAAIDYLDNKGLVDREKVAVGGHSYGAFMTANLLCHTDLFKAGVARSGAYNRSLTPFGFQSERRSYWDAKEFYNKVSPFMNAEKIKTPLLMIHGEEDPNSGTFPLQSERLFAAIKGNGGTARLVMLPYEGHGYAAEESNLHVLAEMAEWLDKYLK